MLRSILETTRMTPRFSIFIPVWNGAAFIGGALESILAQTYSEWELVIGDNASTDGLATVVGRYTDPRIRLHRWSTHTDLNENFNRTMLLCRFGWVQPLGVDDRLMPDCLETMAARMCVESDRPMRLSAVIAAVRRVDSRGQLADASYYGCRGPAKIPNGVHDAASWLHYSLTGVTPWNIGTVAFARDVLAEMGGFLRPEIGLCADIDLILRTSAYGDILYIDEPLMNFAIRGDSDSHTRGLSARAWQRPLAPPNVALVSGFSVHEERREVSKYERAAVHATIAHMQIQRAFQHRYLSGGHGRRGALLDVGRAIRWNPRILLKPHHLTYGLAAVLAPRALISYARSSRLTRLYRSELVGGKDTSAGSSSPCSTAHVDESPLTEKQRSSGRLESALASVISWFSVN
jgi:glycosyltransferase involved in cell wall biosynthesis